MAPLDDARLDAAFEALDAGRATIRQALADARAWEQDVIGQRPTVIDRLLSLA